ncbi:MAG: ATP-binding protein [Candidatus Kerfeldbacteria bacterium]|nr:ATP-binding protein [Candidatus Kerfeldbacteria bacterium]
MDSIVDKINPWKASGSIDLGRVVQRIQLPEIIDALEDEVISLLVGPRQVGKTTLMMLQIEHLINSGVSPKNIWYVNFDYIELRKSENAVEFLAQFELSSTEKTYFFLDEVQLLPTPGVFLKQLYDLQKMNVINTKIVASGSSALEIKSAIKESLAGRKRIFTILPLTFQEFMQYRFANLVPTRRMFDEYMTFGGYPAVVKANNTQKKKQLLAEIVQSYFQKDVTDFLKVQSPQKYNTVLKLLAAQIGNLVNMSEMSNTANVELRTLEQYLFYMQETYLLQIIRPYYRNVRKEVTKQPKVYFFDMGVRNYFLNSFDDVHLRADYGFLAENMVLNELKHRYEQEIYFWRTKNQTEIDFVASNRYDIFDLIEVKAKERKHMRAIKSFASFAEEYTVEKKMVYCFTNKPGVENGIEYRNLF